MYRVDISVTKDGTAVGADHREIDETRYVKTLTGDDAKEALGKAINVLQGSGINAYNKAFYDAYQAAGIDPFPGGGETPNPDLR